MAFNVELFIATLGVVHNKLGMRETNLKRVNDKSLNDMIDWVEFNVLSLRQTMCYCSKSPYSLRIYMIGTRQPLGFMNHEVVDQVDTELNSC